MYRIMMPQGRLVETSEIIFVKDNKDGTLNACNMDVANAIVFKTQTEDIWEIHNVSLSGAFGTTLGSVWNSLLSKGYAGFSKHQLEGEVKAYRVTKDTYDVLKRDIGDITKI